MVKTLLWAIFIVNVFGFTYMLSVNVYTPWIVTLISIVLVYFIGKFIGKKDLDNIK